MYSSLCPDVLKPFQFTASSVTGVKKAASSALKTWEGERKSYKPYRGKEIERKEAREGEMRIW